MFTMPVCIASRQPAVLRTIRIGPGGVGGMAETEKQKLERLRNLRKQRESEVAAGATDWVRGAREVVDQAMRNNARLRLELIDELVETGNANLEEMAEKYGGGSVRDGHLAQVTSILHGEARAVGENFTGGPDWWLTSHLDTRTYEVHPDFVDAWRKVRALFGPK
jgi:hypothetical protein